MPDRGSAKQLRLIVSVREVAATRKPPDKLGQHTGLDGRISEFLGESVEPALNRVRWTVCADATPGPGAKLAPHQERSLATRELASVHRLITGLLRCHAVGGAGRLPSLAPPLSHWASACRSAGALPTQIGSTAQMP